MVYFDYSADLCGSVCSTSNFLRSSVITAKRKYVPLPEISPSEAPQPLLPLLAPSPLTPFTNSTVPKLSGQFSLLNYFQLSIIIKSTFSGDFWLFLTLDYIL